MITSSDEVLFAQCAFLLLVFIWILAPSGLPRGLGFDPDPIDGVPTIPAAQFQEAAGQFLRWAYPRWPVLALPVLIGIAASRFTSGGTGLSLAGLGFDVLGAFALAEGLLDLAVIRWFGTYGWLGPRSRQAALFGREKAKCGLTLIGVGFLLQAMGILAGGLFPNR